MNMTRKLASVVLAMILVLCVVTSAVAQTVSAGEGKASITIENATDGITYGVVKVFDATVTGTENGSITYSGTIAADLENIFEADEAGNISVKEGVSDEDVIKAVTEWAKTQTPVATAVSDGTALVFTGLEYGYYAVVTTKGALVTVDSTNPNAVVREKNEAPEVTKEVQEDSDSSWGKTNDADINQVVNYKATITVQAGAENYILHDTMSAGLTYIGVTSVTASDGSTPVYEVITETADDCTFEVKFDNTYIASLTVGTQIVVEYSAKLNENAVVAGEGNPNEVKLQYGDENKSNFTPVDKTITYTWDAKVVKYTNGENGEVLLAGATFKVSTDEAGNNVIKFHNLGSNEYEVCADSACTKEHVTEITTDSTGTFHIEGLDADTYYLTETKAPDGYNKLAGSIKFTVVAGSDTVEYKTVEAKVENQSGTELPSTGGMGTTLFYVAGGVLVVAAFILLMTKRRVGAEK